MNLSQGLPGPWALRSLCVGTSCPNRKSRGGEARHTPSVLLWSVFFFLSAFSFWEGREEMPSCPSVTLPADLAVFCTPRQR